MHLLRVLELSKKNWKELTPEEQADVEKLLEKIEEDEDVQNVYHTMKESEE